jgi:hypothetical protein
MPSSWRRFHVFLPTQEVCAYPLLVNGAFSTDLSRQRVSVGDEQMEYNAHLIRCAAALYRRSLLPELKRHGTNAVLSTLERDRDVSGVASDAFHEYLTAELAAEPLLPTEDGQHLSMPEAVFPPAILDDDGPSFRDVLGTSPLWSGQRFPSSQYCTGRWSAVAADHGAMALSAEEALTVLGSLADAERSALREDDSGGFEVDPVLELCVTLWERSDAETREEVEQRAKIEPLFPVQHNDNRLVERVPVAGKTAFYPPRSARHELPLHGLRFMAHSLCWGALLPKERTEFLDDKMRAWAALFDIKEFRFEEVMRAAVIPALVLKTDPDVEVMRKRLESMDSLSAICQLAGTYTKPDRPLRYQRLRSDRALFNLSRLPVPCRTPGGEESWLPAYKVYFGRDWIGDDSVESVTDALVAAGADASVLGLPMLDSPDRFLDRLQDLADIVDDADDSPDEDDEVGIEEDTDRALESDEHARWIAFLSWIGVNAALRPVHFHDVEDRDTGWLTTKNLKRPGGWAFDSMDEKWDDYSDELSARLDQRPDIDDIAPYLYEVHDLESIVPLLAAAEDDPEGGVSGALIEHLVRHWEFYESFADAQLALVNKGKYPGQRSKPPKAMPHELVDIGENLWMWRLRQRNICPTSHGPRRPDRTWLSSGEVQRRFGRRGRSPGDLLPLFELAGDLPARSVREIAERIGVRLELSPTTFGIDDARLLCERLERIYGADSIDGSQLRMVIRPVYREMFELLSGRSANEVSSGTLQDAPLLAEMDGEYRFMPAEDVLYARTSGFRERSGVDGQLPAFVLEAEPGATAPLTRLFGVGIIEDSLDWHPDPGECPLDAEELEVFRLGIQDLVPELLARMRAERTENRDRRVLEQFASAVEPVDALALTCTFNGTLIEVGTTREHFVTGQSSNQDLQAFVLWEGPAWPPAADEAQRLAMALADATGLNLVETFLAFLQSDREQRRRLLDISGATGFLQEIEEELSSTPLDEQPPDHEEGIGKTSLPDASSNRSEEAATMTAATKAAVSRVPLLRFEDMEIDGEPLLVFGDRPGDGDTGGDASGRGSGTSGSPSHRAAPGTDLTSLDRLGMQIAMVYELRRLNREGATDAAALTLSNDHVESEDLVVDVSTPAAIAHAEQASPVARAVLADLERRGLSLMYPGFDVLTIRKARAQRLIELKSSGVDARVQTMTWNEWKSARRNDLREMFWLYLVGNLRADLPGPPYLRAINDPFGSLTSKTTSEQHVSRAVQLRVREFDLAEELTIDVHNAEPAEPAEL